MSFLLVPTWYVSEKHTDIFYDICHFSDFSPTIFIFPGFFLRTGKFDLRTGIILGQENFISGQELKVMI